ncbi:hypothetical protein PSHT_08582 [Puccinia striiformis]|uniref:Uncharacterized protein n=1 Tax=Puccinia striiformis TaxID=27350 RepID=A0A2S4VMT0_9BASI|nr:hypothetical protein PSHT_08582 [Puccinia striiformis]
MQSQRVFKFLAVVFIQFEAVLSYAGDKPVGLCSRATELDDLQAAKTYGYVRAMQAGQTATCDQFTIGDGEVQNGACCSTDLGASTKLGDGIFGTKAATDFNSACVLVPTAAP